MRINTKILTRTALLLALAFSVQQLKIQWLTGPAINAILIIAVGFSGPVSGVILGLLTPILAFTQGMMPLAIAVPFIMIGNTLYSLSFYRLKKIQPLVGLIVGAFLKFAFLALSVNFIINVPPKVAQALSTPQLFTAITGGLIGLIILRYLKNSD